MTRKQRRLYFVLLAMLALGGATALVLTALGDTLVYFYTPSEMAGKQIGPDRRVRLGGTATATPIKSRIFPRRIAASLESVQGAVRPRSSAHYSME